MEFWLKQDNDSSGFQLPVNPPSYEIAALMNNGTFDTEMYGERSFLGTEKLKTFEIDSFFPYDKYSFLLCVPKDNPYDYVNIINNWEKNKWPVRVIITETPIKMLCSIEEFHYGEEAGSRDVTFKLMFKEYKKVDGIFLQDATETSSTNSSSSDNTLKAIQGNLNKLKIPNDTKKDLTINGINDSHTKSAVIEFQYIMGIKQDGHWDTTTDNAMKEVISKPTCGAAYTHKYATRYIQWWLGISVDGIFYTKTTIATKKFQKAHKLSQDGVFGSSTWNVIF